MNVNAILYWVVALGCKQLQTAKPKQHWAKSKHMHMQVSKNRMCTTTHPRLTDWFGAILGQIGHILANIDAILGHNGSPRIRSSSYKIEEPRIGAILGQVGTVWARIAPFWAELAPFWSNPAPFWANAQHSAWNLSGSENLPYNEWCMDYSM